MRDNVAERLALALVNYEVLKPSRADMEAERPPRKAIQKDQRAQPYICEYGHLNLILSPAVRLHSIFCQLYYYPNKR